jgi:hypothetical protein
MHWQGTFFDSIKDPRVVGGWIGKIICNKVALAIVCDAYQKGCVWQLHKNMWMHGDYQHMNWQTKSNRYVMWTLEEIFDAIGHPKVFNN